MWHLPPQLRSEGAGPARPAFATRGTPPSPRGSERTRSAYRLRLFVRLRRNAADYRDRMDLGDRFWEFAVDEQGAVTTLVHVAWRDL